MPPDTSSSGTRHVGALDGLRGVAVLVVLLFHGGVSLAQGGFLGVEAFFVLSGFLITALLIAEWQRSGTISLTAFWGRRARRLLPALAVVVVVCALYERSVGPAGAVPDFGADALSTLLYVANWHQIWTGSGYFAQVGLVSPLQHTWSLAIEEQFYLLWPLVLVAVLRHRQRPLPWVLGLSACGAAISALEMALLFDGGGGLDRVYYGTDTRAQGLLVGACLATALAMAGQRSPTARERGGRSGRLAALTGIVGAACFVVAVARATGTSPFLYYGGFLAVDLAVASVILAAVSASPVRSPVRVTLETWPLRFLGVISYGVYLWHFPLFLWLTSSSVGAAGSALLVLRLGASVAAATLSYFLVERPVRERRLHGAALRAAASVGTAVALASVGLAWTVGGAAAAVPPAAAGRSSTIPPGAGSLPSTGACSTTAGAGPALSTGDCPVVTALLVGDSIGLTLGMQLGISDEQYGVRVQDDAQLGCGFVTTGESDLAGEGFGPIYPVCLRAERMWRQAEERDHAGVVVVEMGYWDEVQWLQDGRVVHLGEAGFDAELRHDMLSFVEALSSRRLPLVLLSVPWVNPPPWPDGSAAPQASAARHELIDSMLAGVARQLPGRVYYFDLSPYVTPGNQFDSLVGGEQCRMSDGVHFYVGPAGSPVQTACGLILQRALLPYLRGLVLDTRR